MNNIRENMDQAIDTMKAKHSKLADRYRRFRQLHEEVDRMAQRRRGLRKMEDDKRVDIQRKYDLALERRDEFDFVGERLRHAEVQAEARLADFLSGLTPDALCSTSPFNDAIFKPRIIIQELFQELDRFGKAHKQRLRAAIDAMEQQKKPIARAMGELVRGYEQAVETLSPEDRKLLEAHRDVAEETRALSRRKLELDTAREHAEGIAGELAELCGEIEVLLERRQEVRKEAVRKLSRGLEPDVRLDVTSYVAASASKERRRLYRDSWTVLNKMKSRFPDEQRLHAVLQRVYRELNENIMDGGDDLALNENMDKFFDLVERDDLVIMLRVGSGDDDYKKIDALSAGQRCTAVFPLLLQADGGPLVIDQPEDNLDNRYIADGIAPRVRNDKLVRQMIFTSHNANLVVVSDPEQIVAFESTAVEGRIEQAGFLATRGSTITKHVLDVLDGGKEALELRYRKYGPDSS